MIPPHSDTLLRHLLGGTSVFTMLMTIPQVMTIWFNQQAAGFRCYRGVPTLFCHSVVLVRDKETRQEHLFALRGLDGTN